MKVFVRYSNSKLGKFIKKHEKTAPVVFFIGGFIFDSLTLGRIDRLYDLVVLSFDMIALTIVIYLYNLADDGKWKNTFIGRIEQYFPIVIQFFFGALSSAYVVYFSRSVSLSKTASFFVILVVLLFANEFLKRRISNKYLQFGVYFFISFTFSSFMLPVFIKEMNTEIFIVSGFLSLACTCMLVSITYLLSPSTRAEINLAKLTGIIVAIYCLINVFYFFSLIPPVPLSLDAGMVAHDIRKEHGKYIVSYETDDWYVFWRDHRLEFIHDPKDNVYIFSSIFAPISIEKSIIHRWEWYNTTTNEWEVIEDIGFDIVGGRERGYRGYTFKNNVKEGIWKVEVMTDEELVLGVIDFVIIMDSTQKPQRIVNKKF